MAPPQARQLEKLRRRCEERLLGIELPVPFEVERFAHMLAARRGRTIVLKAIHTQGGTLGAWIPTRGADFIVYEERTAALHQQHIILHELSHILCQHEPAETDAGLFPDLRPEMVRTALRRHRYSSDAELEAELLASLIRERAASLDSGRRPPSIQDPQVAQRLEAFRKGEPSA